MREGFVDRPVDLPCGQCITCRLAKAQAWATRAVHEAQMHERNCFITLTYDDEHLPEDGSLDVRDWQLFAKRLRKKVGPFRFLHCGEYGDNTHRPHYHALLFGLDFHRDRKPWNYHGSSSQLWISDTLESTWGQGFTSIGPLTEQSAAYVARYTVKKATGPGGAERYRRIDLTTGEEFYVRPDYATMSRRPGIGSSWLEKYHRDVYPSDQVVHNGRKLRPPEFYDRRLEASDPGLLADLKEQRRAKAQTDTGNDRLRAVERNQLDRTNARGRKL